MLSRRAPFPCWRVASSWRGLIARPSKIHKRHAITFQPFKLGTDEAQSKPSRFFVHAPALVERTNEQVMRKWNPSVGIL